MKVLGEEIDENDSHYVVKQPIVEMNQKTQQTERRAKEQTRIKKRYNED